MIAPKRDFIGVIVFPSVRCPRNFTRVRQNCDLSGAAFMFCMKKSSNFVTSYFLRMSGQKILLINAENAAGPIAIPEKSIKIILLISYNKLC